MLSDITFPFSADVKLFHIRNAYFMPMMSI